MILGRLIIRPARRIRFDRQTHFPAMLTAAIILALLSLLVATDANPGGDHPSVVEDPST